MKKSANFKIYRLCWDEKSAQSVHSEAEKYSLPETHTEIGSEYDYFEFLRMIIDKSEEDFALVCHDDVVLPLDITERIDECVKKCDKEFGQEKWGVVGNAGIEFLSNEVIRYLWDPHSGILPPGTSRPRVATHIDGNTLLINVRNLRARDFEVPNELSGFHLYDFMMVAESYKCGLVAAVDSALYVRHDSPGNQKTFDNAVKGEKIVGYLRKNFINHKFITLNGWVEIDNSLDYLKPDLEDDRLDYYSLVENVVLPIYHEKDKKTLNIVVRSTLKKENKGKIRRTLDSLIIFRNEALEYIDVNIYLSINNYDDGLNVPDLVAEYENLEINVVQDESIYKDMFPRVRGIRNAVDVIPAGDDQFCWFIDDDDFAMPKFSKYLPWVLESKAIFIGESSMFEEIWSGSSERSVPQKSKILHTKDPRDYYHSLGGDNHVAFSAVIYPIFVLKKVFETLEFRGDYFEDFMIFLAASKLVNTTNPYPLNIVGISFHGKNVSLDKSRVRWNYSYTTFMSELVQNQVMPDMIHKALLSGVYSGDVRYLEFRSVYNDSIWRLVRFYLWAKSVGPKILPKMRNALNRAFVLITRGD